MEPLSQIPREKWRDLYELYKANWPNGITAACNLNMQLIYPALSEEYNFKVFCPQGDVSNGIIVNISNESQHIYDLKIYPFDDITPIEESLRTSNEIDWNKPIMVSSVSSEVWKCLHRIKAEKGITIIDYGDRGIAETLVLKNTARKFENLRCPPDTYIGPLLPEHIATIDKTWTYHGKHTHKFFALLMKHNLTYVLYSNDHKPLAWVTIGESGHLSHLFCLDEHRKKGYAEFVVKYAANEMLDKGQDVIAYLLLDNTPAFKLFDKLGFEKAGEKYWIFMRK